MQASVQRPTFFFILISCLLSIFAPLIQEINDLDLIDVIYNLF
jgi:hypothetical protein